MRLWNGCLLSGCFVIGQLGAQALVRWTAQPGPAPIFRTELSLAFDSARSRVVLFGGQGGQSAETNLGDTWVNTGLGGWTQLNPITVPPARFDHAIAYDSVRDRVVLFGGMVFVNGVFQTLGDTWEFDGSNWLLRTPVASPSQRYGHDMAYYFPDQRVVLYGGNSGPAGWTDMGDTWEWDGTNWFRVVAPAPTPPPARWHAMTYDDARRVVILVHGPLMGSGLQTWEYAASRWRQRLPLTVPPDRWEHGLAYDSARARTVLFGGNQNRNGTYSGVLDDVWEYDGNDWTRRFPATSPPRREGHGMTYDASRGRVVVFGGRDTTSFRRQDTWEYGPSFPATVAEFGTGCAGSLGVPFLTAATGQRPWLGDTVQLALGSMLPGSVAILALGLSNTQWGTLTLPFGLAPLGMPGCTAFVSSDVSLLLPVDGSGAAQQVVSVPANQALLGLAVYVQALALDPGINAVGATVTNAAQLFVGAR